jgi:hypothetical protein
MSTFAAIEWDKLLQVVWVSLLAGVGVTALFSIVIYGGARAHESRRLGQGTSATIFTVLAVVSLIAFLSGVVFGVSIILNK